MKPSTKNNMTRRAMIQKTTGLVALGITGIPLANAVPSSNGTWRFAVIGDHRGDNDPGKIGPDGFYTKLVHGPDGKYIGFKDGGINQVVLAQLAATLQSEHVEFVLEIGDLVTKHISQINGRTPDALLTEELTLWAQIWNENSGGLDIYPVRGNQEWTASAQVWLDFIKGMPGIGELRPNGPEGEVGMTYGFHYKNCLFLGIDDYFSPAASGDSHVVTPAAQAWLDRVLAEADRPFKFVYGHAPAFEVWNTKVTKFTGVKDGLANPQGKFTPAAIASRNAFWNSVGSAGAEYFCGHEHIFARGVNATATGRLVRQTVIGNGGAPSSPAYDPAVYNLGPFAESYAGITLPSVPPGLMLDVPLITSETPPRGATEYGYVIVEVHGSHVTATYKALTGGYLESWEIAKFDD
jgi:hypothetical protein